MSKDLVASGVDPNTGPVSRRAMRANPRGNAMNVRLMTSAAVSAVVATLALGGAAVTADAQEGTLDSMGASTELCKWDCPIG